MSKACKFYLNICNKQTLHNLTGVLDIGLASQHLTISELVLLNLLPSNIESYTTFAISRNPFTRMKSLFCHWSNPKDWTNENLELFCTNWPSDRQSIRHNLLSHKRCQYEFVDNYFNQDIKVQIIKLEELNLHNVIPNSTHRIKLLDEAQYRNHLPSTYADMKQNLRLSKAAAQSIRSYYAVDFDFFSYSTVHESSS